MNEDHTPTKKKERDIPVKCKTCDFNAKNETHLKKHLEVAHLKKNVKEFHNPTKKNSRDSLMKCKTCDFNVKDETHLKKHMEVAHIKKNNSCWFWGNSSCKNSRIACTSIQINKSVKTKLIASIGLIVGSNTMKGFNANFN